VSPVPAVRSKAALRGPTLIGSPWQAELHVDLPFLLPNLPVWRAGPLAKPLRDV